MADFIQLTDMHGDRYSVNIEKISSILWGFCFQMRDMVIFSPEEKIFLTHKSPSSYRLAKAVGVDLDKLMDQVED